IALQCFFEHLLAQVVQVQVLLFFFGLHIFLCYGILGGIGTTNGSIHKIDENIGKDELDELERIYLRLLENLFAS
nr:hypothetical protein [Succinivibrionaceae bacterium]